MKTYIEIISGIKLAKTLAVMPDCELKFASAISRLKKGGRLGFTLAEVLITLTIIGVIAAMTIPALLSKYEKHTYVVGLKKANSQLQNAFQLLPAQRNCSSGDASCTFWADDGNNTVDGIDFERTVHKRVYLLSTMFKNAKYIHDTEGRYFPKQYYMNIDNNLITNRSDDQSYGFITEDGMSITTAGQLYIIVDVNGKKGPNRYGRDIFMFSASDYSIGPDGRTSTTEELIEYCPRIIQACGARVLAEDAMNY